MVKFIETKAEFDALVADNKDKLIVVDFTASWCGPCKMIGPVFEKLAEEHSDVIFVKVDVDANDETAGACGISAMPTFQCYKNGQKVEEMCGASKEKLEALVAKHK
ncbi:thioredoxin-like [Branchiostoma lanceolatum]|uniref:thioredoxin-like n=1 Tax=Branchiostoma lanceolatum TaxID=7740 RepID=UPI0034533E39